jgi:polysaccharide export outer membrane protein
MHKSPARLILFSLCVQGMVLVPVLAQDTKNATPSGAPVSTPADPAAAYVPANQGPNTSTANTGGAHLANYILGPEDQITVRVFAANDIPDKPAQIANDGTVTLAMVGKVQAAGLTVSQLQTALVTAYKKYFKDPQVTVEVNDFRSQPVSVAGNVNTPGVVQLRGNRNLMEVIGQAGGLRIDAGDSVLITRRLSEGTIPVAGAFTDPTGKYSIAHIDIRAIMSGKDPQGNILIKPHDVITVPRARMIYVLGNVNRPGGYVMADNESVSLTQAIALAGGWNPYAALSGTRILRAAGGGEREQIPANIKKIMENKAPDPQMQPDDILYIPNNMLKQYSGTGIDSAIGVGSGLAIYR